MITNQTVIWAGDYEIKMTVYDNAEWLVSINNAVLEVGATSNPCQPNWNKGVAEAVMSICSMMESEDCSELIKSLQNCGFIHFKDVLNEMVKLVDPDPFEVDEDELFDTMEASWGDQYDSLQ